MDRGEDETPIWLFEDGTPAWKRWAIVFGWGIYDGAVVAVKTVLAISFIVIGLMILTMLFS